MQHTKILVFLLCIILIFSCKKGDTGPQGLPGNANVTQYSFGEQNFPLTFYVTLMITNSADSSENSAWFTWLYYNPNARWYAVPGLGSGGATQYRSSIAYLNGKTNIYIDKVGPGEVFTKAKVVRVYTGAPVPGGRQARTLPDIDFNDYNAVKQYYKLPD
jgi:hypothetical protein